MSSTAQESPTATGSVGFISPEDARFAAVLAVGLIVSALTYRTPHIAMWVGFVFAGYSAVANDSIQTLGTFLASNSKQKWWVLWLWIGGIFLATVTYSFVFYDGDVSYGRLAAKGFETAPDSFVYMQVAAPLVLLILTRFRMPVSTTFLLLSIFSTSASGVGKVLTKSLSGYLLAFVVAIVAWTALSSIIKRFEGTTAHPAWRIGQWVSTGLLWSVWLQQDAANVAVYLPRQMTVTEFAGFAGLLTAALGVLIYLRGGRIQSIVTEKADVYDVRSATLIDFVYAIILFVFKMWSQVPMSTTWVFIGLLAGREVAMLFTRTSKDQRWSKVGGVIGRDILFAAIGLVVSMVLAFGINAAFRRQVLDLVGAG
ncbi:MAG: hypothetical protein AAFU77_06170 [Myxococcota bacterium]